MYINILQLQKKRLIILQLFDKIIARTRETRTHA